MKLLRITLAVIFQKHPGSAVSLPGEFKTSWYQWGQLILTTSLTESILMEFLELWRGQSQTSELQNALK